MCLRRWGTIGLIVVSAAAVCTLGSTPARAQLGGVDVDAKGQLKTFKVDDPDGSLTRQRMREALAALNPDVARRSNVRKISLGRLEAALRKRLDEGRGASDEMKYLAGLTRIQYVFYYPDTKDIVIAGPAEGWATVAPGRVIGLHTGRATLELQDLVVALRVFQPGSKQRGTVFCSIDPTQEGLARLNQYLRANRPLPNQRSADRFVAGMRESLGLHNVRVGGVPTDTHMAQVLVEADYRMKLIGLGIEQPAVPLKSYVDLANVAAIARNAMQRWFFVPDYQCLRMSEDGLAMQLVGDGVKLINADEVVREDGTRAKAGTPNRGSELFTQGFTKMYGRLADKTPIFAQLRNTIDLLVAAAFIQEQDYYGKAGWRMETFGDEKVFAVRTYQEPRVVDAAARAVFKGNRLATPIGGGVHIRPRDALKADSLLEDDGKASAQRSRIDLGKLAADRWWWD